MEKVIPYTEEIANSKNYLYIKPNGEIVKSPYDHYVWPECFCAIYCNGLKKDSKKIERSKLNKKEKELLKEYLNAFNNKELIVAYDSLYETFLISVLSYDKISIRHKTIVTACENLLVKYQDFLKNDWAVIEAKPIDLDEIDKAYCYKKSRCARKLNKNIKE